MHPTIEHIKGACEQFDIDWTRVEEWHLLPAVRQFLELPMPTFWKSTVGRFACPARESVQVQGDICETLAQSTSSCQFFLDTRTSLVHTKHPLSAQFRSLIGHLRATRHLDSWVPPGTQQTHLQLKHPGGERYFWDLVNQQTCDNCQEDAILQPVSQELLVKFGLVGDAKHRVRHLSELTFKSWWFEDCENQDLTFRCDGSQAGGGVRKRYISLRYKLKEESFDIITHDGGQDLILPDVVSCTTHSGSPVQVWDLHVGARLSFMGKTIELSQASLDTSLWIDQQANSLRKLRDRMLEELKKYKTLPRKAAATYDYGSKLPGGCCLRQLVTQVEAAAEELQQWRPSRAEFYLQQAEACLEPARTAAS